MRFYETRDQELLADHLQKQTASHLYALADLDEPFWSNTRWFVAEESSEVRAVVLLLEKMTLPVVYAIAPAGCPYTKALLEGVKSQLPTVFYAHVACGILDDMPGIRFFPEGRFQKMILTRFTPKEQERVQATTDFSDLQNFYLNSAYDEKDHEERFFEKYMVDLHPYYIMKEYDQIVAAAGVHVLSEVYKVCALGNIATAPKNRGHGYAQQVVTALISSLQPRVEHIGLNVRLDNESGVACYTNLGFQPVCEFVEGPARRQS